MRNALYIFKRELGSYFEQPLAYFALTMFLGMVAIFSLWFHDLLLSGVASMRVPFFWMATMLLLLAPAITMRSIAEERRTGSIEMLLTLPVSPTEVVVGKWMAALFLLLCGLALTLTYPVALSLLSTLDWGPVLGGYLGLGLMAGAFAAIGVAASTTSQNQIVSFLIATSVTLIPFALGYFLSIVPGESLAWVQYLTFEYHFSNLAKGVIDSRSVVFYCSIVVVALQTSSTLLHSRRLS